MATYGGIVRPGWHPEQNGNPGWWAGGQPPGTTIANMRANVQQPAAGAPWSPSFLQTSPVPYPRSPYADYGGTTGGRGVGGYGGGYGGGGSGVAVPQANAYNPTMFQGPGAYWPGHQAEFQGQQQAAIMGIMQGQLQADTRQPAQMAAQLARAQQSGHPGIRRSLGMSAYGGGGGYSRGSAGGIGGDFQRGMDDARQSNEARYRDILEGYQNRMGYLQGAGNQEYQDINQSYDSQKASGLQGLTGRGLGNSTLVNTMGMGYDRERSDSIGRLEERLRGQYMDTQKDTLDFMERRVDQPPSLDILNQIGQLQGQSGSGAPQSYQVSMQSIPMGGGAYYTGGGGGSGGYAVPGSSTQRQMAIIKAQAAAANAKKAAQKAVQQAPQVFIDPLQLRRAQGLA